MNITKLAHVALKGLSEYVLLVVPLTFALVMLIISLILERLGISP